MNQPNDADPRDPSDTPADATQRPADEANAVAGFADLYVRLAPALHAWATLRISPSLRGRLDPEDVVQEVWWRAMDARDSYDPRKGPFRAWIFQIANRVLLNGFRSLYVRGQMSDPARPFQVTVPDHLAAEATSISERAARDELALHLLRQVELLEPEDRVLFSYCALEGMTCAKAAILLGIGEAAAAKRWQRLRGRLREALQSPLFEA